MPDRSRTRRGAGGRAARIAALVLATLGIPVILSIEGFSQDAPIEVGAPSPRTVIAPGLVRVPDAEATALQREQAREDVAPVLEVNTEAISASTAEIRAAFDTVEAVREPTDGGPSLTVQEQVDALQGQLETVDDEGIRRLVSMPNEELISAETLALSIAREFARREVRESQVEQVADRLLQIELSSSGLPPELGESVVAPVVQAALRPTVVEDVEATLARREEAAAQVEEQRRTYVPGELIVATGQEVTEVQQLALQEAGLAGEDAERTFLIALALAIVASAVVALYIRTYRPSVWADSRVMLLLALLVALSAVAFEALALLPADLRPAWSFLVPVGAIAMLTTILVDPPVGVLLAVPHTVIAAVSLPEEPALAPYAALVTLVSVPLVTRLSARGDLRRAAWQATLGYALIAAGTSFALLDLDVVGEAMLAGLASGVISAIVVIGVLPFLESWFGISTATSLSDLADRNHPILRDLEQHAVGTYNHSIMVSTMVERAARAIGADAALVTVQALYHDIGKLEQPWFFVENQFGIANPHDDLDPYQSADIIRRHVPDGVQRARSHRLPPDVVGGIASHHGTTVVAYFHRRAVELAPHGETVREEDFRYPGPRPATREEALLMLADCCESATRAAAQADRNLSRDALESIVHRLVRARFDDGQLDDSTLTVKDLVAAQASFIDTLTGVYHPRIAYPDDPPAPDRDAARERPLPEAEAAGDRVEKPHQAPERTPGGVGRS